MNNLSLANAFTVSLSGAQAGLGKFNTSNVALFTRESFGPGFGDLGYKIYLDASSVVTDFGTDSTTAAMAISLFSQQPNILTGGGYLVVIPFLDSEIIEEAIVRTKDLIQYFGILAAEITTAPNLSTAATLIQTLNKMALWPSNLSADIHTGGKLDLLRTGTEKQNRGLYYGSADELSALEFSAAYAGRGFSTDFTGSNTTQTMHLKDMIGIQPDPTIDQTTLNLAQAAGADCYISLEGLPKVFTSGANGFFDQVYNSQWLVTSIRISGFNVLAQTSTKIVQTEAGVDLLKAAFRRVLDQGVTNAYLAPGEWTSPDTFGNQKDFLRNIREKGYYIFTTPIALQDPTDRAARKSPLCQIAVKEAGAIHSGNVIISVNA